jgi:hypothetical protein
MSSASAETSIVEPNLHIACDAETHASGGSGARGGDNSHMQQRDGQVTFSPSDLSAFLACAHLTSLEVAVARGELTTPTGTTPTPS